MPRPTLSGLREAGTNLVAAALFLAFAAVHVRGFVATGRPSLLVVVALEAIVAVLFLLRDPAARASSSAYDWITSAGGTMTPFFLRPVAEGHDLAVGQLIQCAGGALAALTLLSLSRSFGVLPAIRTVRSGGAYRWVRHPLYAAYTVQSLGYLLSNPTVRNGAVAVLALGFQVLRIYSEERLLASDPAYARYMERTRWRLLPRVF